MDPQQSAAWEPRVVEVRMTFPGTTNHRMTCTGIIIAPHLVLTTAHSVNDSGTIAVRGIDDRSFVSASLRYRRYEPTGDHPAIDTAVLHVPNLRSAGRGIRWGSVDGDTTEPCRILGFPRASERAGLPEFELFEGRAFPGSGARHGWLHVDVSGAVPNYGNGWAGLSGAPIFGPDDVLLGIIAQQPEGWGGGRLWGVPSSTLLNDDTIADLTDRPRLHSIGGNSPLVTAPYRRPRADAPHVSELRLLQARSQIVPFVVDGRAEVLDDLIAWCADDAPFGTRVLSGPAGSGKSRLAAELCQRLLNDKTTRWHAGFANAEPTTPWRTHSPKRPLAIVFDYADQAKDHVVAFLENMTQLLDENRLDAKVRILLVGRHHDGLVEACDYDGTLTRILREPLNNDIELEPAEFTNELKQAHLDAAYARFLHPDCHPSASPIEPDVSDPRFDTPLMVHIAALLGARGVDLPKPNGHEIHTRLLDQLLSRECKRWMDQRTAAGSPVFQDRRHAQEAVFIATITAPTISDLPKVLASSPLWADATDLERELIANALHSLYPEDESTDDDIEPLRVAPLRPDIVAEHLIDCTPRRQEILQRLHELPGIPPYCFSNVLAALARAADHYPSARADLSQYLTKNLERLLEPTQERPADVHQLLAEHMDHLVGTAFNCAVDQDDPTAANLLATALERFRHDPAVREAALGPALWLEHPNINMDRLRVVLAELSVQHCHDTGDHKRLAVAQYVLSNRLLNAGLWGAALNSIESAIRTYESLPSDDKTTKDGLLLVECLGQLGAVLRTSGQFDRSLAAMRQSVTLARRLESADPNHTNSLGRALQGLATMLHEADQNPEALTLINEAAELFRSLPGKNLLQQGATSAHILRTRSIILASLGKTEKALEDVESAISLLRILDAVPGFDRHALAESLTNQGNLLAELGRHDDALTATEEAAGVYESLQHRNPKAFGALFASTLGNLAIDYTHGGRTDEAAEVSARALGIIKDLFDEDPNAHAHIYAEALINRSNLLIGLKDYDGALEPLTLGTEILTVLVDRYPDTHLNMLRKARENLTSLLDFLDHHDDLAELAPDLMLDDPGGGEQPYH